MADRIRLSNLLLSCSLILIARVSFAQEVTTSPPVKVAIVEATVGKPLPGSVLDLLFLELSKNPAIELLERQEIARILREQRLSTTFESPEESLQTGKLLAADVLLILQSDPIAESSAQSPSKVRSAVRLKIVETREGIQFSDAAFPLLEEGSQDSLSVMTSHIHSQLRRIRESVEGLKLVAVGDFRSRDISRHADWLGPVITSNLENRLAGSPGILLMERKQVRPLIEERALTINQLPAALRGAMVRIEGEFWLEASSPEVLAHVRVNRRLPGSEVKSLQVTAPFSHPELLSEKVLLAARELLGAQLVEGEFKNQAEAALLADEAERLLDLQEREAATRTLLAAYALDPESFRVQVLLLNAGCPELDFRVWGQEPLHGDRLQQFNDDVVPMLWLLTTLSHQILDHPDFPQNPKANWHPIFHLETILRQISHCLHRLRYLTMYLDMSRPENLEKFEALRSEMSLVAIRLRDLTKPLRNQLRSTYASLHIAARSYWWQKTPEEALMEDRRVLEEAMTEREYFLSEVMRASYFELHYIPSWKSRPDLYEVYLRSLDDLATSEHANLRAESLRRRVNFYQHQLKDPVKARQYYFKYIDALIKDVIPQHPELDQDLQTLVTNLGGVNVLGLPPADIADSYSRVIRAAIPRALRRNPQLWEYTVSEAASAYERTGDVIAAEQLLSDFIVAVDLMEEKHHDKELAAGFRGSREALRERHPGVLNATPELIWESPTTTVLFRLEDLAGKIPKQIYPKQIELQQVVKTDRGLAVVAATWTDYRVGVIRLTPDRKSVADVTFSEKMPAKGSCTVTAIGDDVFVGHSQAGVLHFAPGGTTIHYSRRYNSEQSPTQRPFPADEITQIVATNGKVYCMLDPSQGEYGLIELDPGTGTSNVLFSRRGGPVDHPFNGLRGKSNTNGLNGPRLKAIAAADDGTLFAAIAGGAYGDLRGLFRIWPGTQKYELVEDYPREWYQMSGGRILVQSDQSAYQLDPETGKFELLMESGRSSGKLGPPWKYLFSPGRFETRNDHLVCFGVRPGRRELDLFHFHPQQENPTLLKIAGANNQAKSLPPSFARTDQLLWPADSGLLLLTREALIEIELPSRPGQ
ncbi:hypothetical protein SH661x_002716 [Planctomicrobium sp. SH661]|uniref:hypothetical protein n=1 Tax=Planctomicrobium sp. SH661 TaxID=3448124 RepID=UPI003F5BF085